MPRSTGSDQRRYPRLGVELTVRSGSRSWTTSDVSVDGLFLPTVRPDPMGTKLTLLIDVAGLSEPLTLHGQVVRSVPFGPNRGMAIWLVHPSQSRRAYFSGILARLSLKPDLHAWRPRAPSSAGH